MNKEDIVYIGAAAARCRSGWEEITLSKIRSGGCEEIPHIQGKRPQLHFAGAAMKRYPKSK